MDIELRKVSVRLEATTVLPPTSFTAAPGEMIALVGPSGCGKTTALNVASLLITPSAGEVIIGGQVATSWTERQKRAFWRTHASFVFQDLGLVLEDSVIDNVYLALERRRQDRSLVLESLRTVGLLHRENDPASLLSGGERQRVAIARSMAKRADTLFVDEPTASLDEQNRDLVYALLRQRCADGATILVASHDKWVINQCDSQVQIGVSAS